MLLGEPMSNSERRYSSSTVFGRVAILAVGISTLTGCAKDVPPIACADADFDCFVRQATAGITIVRENISYWSNVNLIGQALIVVAGIVATIMIALQGDENKV